MDLCQSYLRAMRQSSDQASSLLVELKAAVLAQGLPNQGKDTESKQYTQRGLVWKILLEVFTVDVSSYEAILRQGACEKYSKIRDDSFRTFQTSVEYQSVVPEAELIRVLNAHAHQSHDGPVFMQGLNLMCGPLLYCMSELDAFFAFEKLIAKTSYYWKSNYIAAQAGCVLVDRVLSEADPQLAQHLASKGLSAFLYAFACVSSFCAAARPFNELLHIWDFLFVCGVHFNVICVAAQVLLLREELLATEKPKQLLDYRVWPPLRSKPVLELVRAVTPTLSTPLWEDITQHVCNLEVISRLTNRSV